MLFPGVVQALHIFEPRYRQLIEDALASDELVTMAMVDLNAVGVDEVRPELQPTVCIGKIVSHTQLDDGRFNLLLVGTVRAKITEEIVTDYPYRMAKVDPVSDLNGYAPNDAGELNRLLLDMFRQLVDRRGVSDVDSLARLLKGDLPLGQISDLICYACGADPNQQYQVLEEAEVCRRAEIVVKILKEMLVGAKPDENPDDEFPPRFSIN